jgi:hypothetical protein
MKNFNVASRGIGMFREQPKNRIWRLIFKPKWVKSTLPFIYNWVKKERIIVDFKLLGFDLVLKKA